MQRWVVGSTFQSTMVPIDLSSGRGGRFDLSGKRGGGIRARSESGLFGVGLGDEGTSWSGGGGSGFDLRNGACPGSEGVQIGAGG